MNIISIGHNSGFAFLCLIKKICAALQAAQITKFSESSEIPEIIIIYSIALSPQIMQYIHP